MKTTPVRVSASFCSEGERGHHTCSQKDASFPSERDRANHNCSGKDASFYSGHEPVTVSDTLVCMFRHTQGVPACAEQRRHRTPNMCTKGCLLPVRTRQGEPQLFAKGCVLLFRTRQGKPCLFAPLRLSISDATQSRLGSCPLGGYEHTQGDG